MTEVLSLTMENTKAYIIYSHKNPKRRTAILRYLPEANVLMKPSGSVGSLDECPCRYTGPGPTELPGFTKRNGSGCGQLLADASLKISLEDLGLGR